MSGSIILTVMDYPENISLNQKSALLNYLKSFISDNKNSLFEKIIKDRTKHITLVLEDIFQPHNASAVLRSCDCFGIQDVHIIENENEFNVNPDVALGSSKWLEIFKYNIEENNTLNCLSKLKEQGYRIVATSPHVRQQSLENIPIDNKMAILFGTELKGLSDIALEAADDFLYIPMYGFTESLNISVSAALTMFHLTEKLKVSINNWRLSEEEAVDVQLGWARNVVNNSHLIEKEFFTRLC